MEQDVIDQLINRFAEKYPYKMALKTGPPIQQAQVQPIEQAVQSVTEPVVQEQPILHVIPDEQPKSEDEILLNQLEQLEQIQNIEFPSRPTRHSNGSSMNFWLFVVLIILIVGIILYLIMKRR